MEACLSMEESDDRTSYLKCLGALETLERKVREQDLSPDEAKRQLSPLLQQYAQAMNFMELNSGE